MIIFMKTIFDIGMYDGADTKYYLSQGYKVVAVEANPALIDKVKHQLSKEVESGQLILVNAAVVEKECQQVELTISGSDIGSSSIFRRRVEADDPVAALIKVKGVTLNNLIDLYGVPFYLKVDIEGADKFAVLPIKADKRPTYLSFEVSEDYEELLNYAESIGYSKFKFISQCCFRELDNERNLADKICRKIIYTLGFKNASHLRRKGIFFKIGHSSGPVPWQSDGTWCSKEELIQKRDRAKQTNNWQGWYDIHAM